MRIALRAGPADAGERVDVFLSKAVPVMSRSKAAASLRTGAILVDGVAWKPSHRLRGGELLEGELPVPPPPAVEPEDIPIPILYEDEHLAVVAKPAGLVVHPAGRLRSGTLVNALLYHLSALSDVGGSCRPGLVHRLDKDTSGLLVVAKHDIAHHRLSLQVQSREMERRYIAFVWGRPPSSEGRVDKPLARSRRDRRRFAADPAGKPAVTHYRLVEDFGLASRLEVILETGRTHQIRVHMSYVGHPVVGDPTYGGRQRALGRLSASQKTRGRAMLQVIPRQALHAYRLAFRHPATGARLSFTSPMPKDMAELEHLLRGTGGDGAETDGTRAAPEH
jgi:23S rRNA pseudouridine1911/1915/1917 synthase